MTAILYFLIGPTAVGKTDLSLEWAERMDAEIVSCDSLLFYQGMDIGTAKPTRQERERVPHHLIDLVPVSEPFNLPRFLDAAGKAIADIRSRGKKVLITGGSGFYLHSFFQPLPQELPADNGVRESLQCLQEEKGLPGLLEELDRLHPEGTVGLDRNNPHRVFNALLRSRQLGLSWEEMRAQWQNGPLPFAEFTRKVVRLGRPDEEMFTRIELRVRQMMQQGLLEEVERLRVAGIENNPTARSSIGYREILQNPQASQEEWISLIALHTRQLVRKQEKWFRSKFASVPIRHPELVRQDFNDL